MKKTYIKKICISFLMISIFLFIGTFFHVTDINAKTYERYNSWYGQALEFDSLDPSFIDFESVYEPFSTIIDDINLVDDQKSYVIQSAFDLYMFSSLSNGINHDIYRRLNYVLGQDINYYDLLITDSSKTFEPIGFRYPFLGSFNGQGFEITNLYLEPILDSTVYENKYLGLVFIAMFSHIGSQGRVENFGLINPIIIQPIEWGAMSYISSVAGLNEGLISHVYYIDTRGHQSGFNAEGAFHVSGLVSKNLGTLKESFVSSPHIKSLAVIENIETNVVLCENQGIIEHIYYDIDVLDDNQVLTNDAIGLSSIDFQNNLYFDDSWFFNDHYTGLTDDLNLKSQFLLNLIYPSLKGLKTYNQELYIEDATDLLYMNRLFEVSNMFRSANYKVIRDIDMHQVSFDAYHQAAFGFSGKFSSSLITNESILYERNENQNGNINYHSIIGLTITSASYVGQFASYSLFSSLFGRVEHLNFIDSKIITHDIDQTYERDVLNVGLIAGIMNQATIFDVHVDVEIQVLQSSKNAGKLLIGALAGQGSGQIEKASSTGIVTIESQIYQPKLNESSLGGIIGQSVDINLNQVINHTELHGINYQNQSNHRNYLGGIIGSGSINQASELVNKANIYPSQQGYLDLVYVGGLFGYITEVKGSLSKLYNLGDLIVDVNKKLNMNINGIGYIKNNQQNTLMTSITNHGHVQFNSGFELTENQLIESRVDLSLGITLEGSATLYGLYQTQNQLIDLSFINRFSGMFTKVGTGVATLTKVYQKGNLSFITSKPLTKANVKLSGVILGENYDLEHIRQEGDIDVDISFNTLLTEQGKLSIFGLFETISEDHIALSGYQGGNITIEKDELIDVYYDLFISGIAYKHENTIFFADHHINSRSIEITKENGSMDTMLNSGDINIKGDFSGHIKVSGIVLFNYGLLTNAINLGNISILNDVDTLNNQIEASGIAYAQIGEYAHLKDVANNGDIKVVSHTGLGFAHASGIVLRNDKNEDQSDVTPGNLSKFSKILFSANYGDIYAFNNSNESSYLITDETRSKASGLLAIGLLSSVNNVNYGNIYSNHLASAMIGFIYLNKFGTIGYDEVYIANSINYGKVREITDYDQQNEIFSINENQAPSSASYQAFGAIVGKIHTNTSSWSFAGDVDYPIDRIYFGYLLNFDDKINMFSRAPSLSSSWQDVFGGDATTANLAILEMQKYMATTNPNDQSTAPFSYFFAGGFFGQYLGKKITYYDLSDQDTGIFYEDFAFRSQRPIYKGTDQYILDYISYIPRDKINTSILDRLESGSENQYLGIYALSSSSGIGNGIFIPDNFEVDSLTEFNEASPTGDYTFLGDASLVGTISYQLYIEMRQIKMDFATTIYDLEIKQTDLSGNYLENGLTLKDPIIDEQRSLITYYLPSNASILGQQSPTLMNVTSYVEVSPNINGARKVLDIPGSGDPTYTWVGTHKKSLNQMDEIGPYDTKGLYNLTSTFENYDSYNRNNPVYNYSSQTYETIGAVDGIFIHNPNVETLVIFFKMWIASGYRVTAGLAQDAGYAPYERFSLPNYPPLYRYVGPFKDDVTYVESDNLTGVSVFDPTDVYFKASIEDESYQISKNASFTHHETSKNEQISIPRSYGIYDLMSYQGTYIDSVEDHYGSVRIYSASYQEADPATYKDYQIRVIRTAEESITDLLSLNVNSIDALPIAYNHENVTSTIILDGTNDNKLEIKYETHNMADLYNVLTHVEVYHYETEIKVHTSLYKLSYGYVQTQTEFNNLDGTWGYGEVDILFEPSVDFESGDYTLKTTLLSGQSYEIHFTKAESSLNEILSLTYQNEILLPVDDMIISYIDYGMYFDEAIEETNIVNFNGLDSIIDVYYTDLDNQLPLYIEGLEISYFSTLKQINLVITRLIDLRYQYDIIYLIEAEDLSLSSFTHRLIEKEVSLNADKVYKNGGEMDNMVEINISYNEAPTLRAAYDLSTLFMPHQEVFSIQSSFIPLMIGEQAYDQIDYFSYIVNEVGYEIAFNKDVGKGSFVFNLSYSNEVSLWDKVLSWDITFNDIIINKLRNDQSKIKDILFVSDTIFSGFNTIMDIELITKTMYENYMINPSTRKINVLPSTGIAYHIYENENTYYMIGQVQKTNLALYEPLFYISDYSIIKKVVDEQNTHYDFQSDDLKADFSPNADTFNFVHYRIYAEDYDSNDQHYTDYYVAVQDVTNNIRFELAIDNQSIKEISNIYVSIDICQVEGLCDQTNTLYKMGVFSNYDIITSKFIHTQFQTTMHGTYQINVTLDKGLTYRVVLQQSLIDGSSFYLEDSILPRKYYITIIVSDIDEQNHWGFKDYIDQNE